MKSKYSAQQITEMEEAKQKDARKSGFALMGTRDSGRAKLDNGVVVEWHVDRDWSEEVNGIATKDSTVPPGTFKIDGKLYDAENLRHWLRWA